jgi:hypothetical protein
MTDYARYPGKDGYVVSVDQCYLCKRWFETVRLISISVSDQGGGKVIKPSCQKCVADAVHEKGAGGL